MTGYRPSDQGPSVTGPARVAMWAGAVFGVWQGLTILLADPVRFDGPGYTLLRTFPGGMAAWGWWAFAAGGIIAVGKLSYHWLPRAAGLLLLSLWAGTFGVASFITTRIVPTAGPTGGPTYITFAVLLAVLIGYRRRHAT